jgi:hypothetical protein
MVSQPIFVVVQRRKKAGKVKRGRERQMTKEKMIKSPDNLQNQNCSVLVGLLMDLIAVKK